MHNSLAALASLNSARDFVSGRTMSSARENRPVDSMPKELPLWGSKCSVCGLGFLSWAKEHVGELVALHQETEHAEREEWHRLLGIPQPDRRCESMKRPPPR